MQKIWIGLLSFCLLPALAEANTSILQTGSSTLFPFATLVAEQYASLSGQPTPMIEATGTGGGMKSFCQGGKGAPDVVGASRRIKESERSLCLENGVKNIIEIPLGADGIVLAYNQSAKHFDLTRLQLWRALAKQVFVNGAWQNNPYQKWQDVDAGLPDIPIRVYGPPPTSGTRDSFLELVMDVGCSAEPAIKAMPEKQRAAYCRLIREDGAYIDAGENDNLIIQKLSQDREALGIFGFSFYDQNRDKMQAAAIEGIAPERENFYQERYELMRTLYVYVQEEKLRNHSALAEYLREYFSEEAMGVGGYLRSHGFIPLPEKEKLATLAKLNKAALQP